MEQNLFGEIDYNQTREYRKPYSRVRERLHAFDLREANIGSVGECIPGRGEKRKRGGEKRGEQKLIIN